jgi:antitoxin component YwqK of YwqJK toxin-antitoxin module
MAMANGERYKGEFCYGEPHGEGVHYSAEGKVKREGEWRHGKFVN